ncbi:MAG: hypothetical protein GQ556_06565, partial [Desulfobacterales bacterium]|nr:hypothetical protein [Desulfobacterales bacterium]
VFNFAATGFNSPLASTTSSTHTIPNISESTSTPIDIHDFGACASCHDTTDMFNPGGVPHPLVTGATAPNPKKVWPYHAAGMLEDYNNVPNLPGADGDPGNSEPEGYPYIPLDKTMTSNGAPPGFYNESLVDTFPELADETLPVFNDDQAAPYRDDLFFAYHFHPGRGGITDTSTTIQNGGQDVGSFNILYEFISPAAGGNAQNQYLKKNKSVLGAGSCPQGADKKYYMPGTAACDTAYVASNFAAPNSNYEDPYGNIWDFSNLVNIPYVDWVSPKPTDAYWVTVPIFAKKTLPTMPDKVWITKFECGSSPNVEVYSQLTTDYHVGLSNGSYGFEALCPSTTCPNGKVQISIDGAPSVNPDNWNATSERWEYDIPGCTSGQTVDASSDFSGTSNATQRTTLP